MKRLVLVIELDVSDSTTAATVDDFDLAAMFGDNLNTWSVYAPLEDNAPIRLNVTTEGVEEI